MRPFLVVGLDPIIEIALQVADRAVDFLAERDAVELVEHRLVEPLDDSIGLMLEVADSVGRGGLLRLRRPNAIDRTP